MDGEIVEAVAQAIRESFANKSGRARPWHEIPEKIREEFRDDARAAIRAYERVNRPRPR